VRYTIIDEDEAPARPMFKRVNRLSLEMDALVASLTPDQVGRIEHTDDFTPARLRVKVYEAAARHGRPVDVWEEDGVTYAALADEAPDRDRR
jgi:hypothetical protein